MPSMPEDATPPDRILNLWATVIGQVTLPDHEAANRELIELAASPDSQSNLFEARAPAVRWLREHVDRAVGEWLDGVDSSRARDWRLHGWLETLGFCEYRDLGNDPGCLLAGLYFVNEPAPPELDHLRSDCDPSCISFFDPRVGFNATALEGDPYYSQVKSVLPEAGVLMLWPGYVRHLTRVHLSHRPWVLVRFRVLVPPAAPSRSTP